VRHVLFSLGVGDRVELRVPFFNLLRDENIYEFVTKRFTGEGARVQCLNGLQQGARQPLNIGAATQRRLLQVEVGVERLTGIDFPLISGVRFSMQGRFIGSRNIAERLLRP
jgi:hypothetical protein